MRKLKNRRIPNGTYGGVRGRRAEARLLLDGRRLSISGCAAVGILMTLSPKRGNDAAGGSLPRRELPTGLRDGDGNFGRGTSDGRCQTGSALRRFQRLTSVAFAEPASARRIHPLAFGLPPFGLKGRRFDGQAKRLLYSGQTWKSYVGILQRMPKPGSFASLACTLSELLKARPKDVHL